MKADLITFHRHQFDLNKAADVQALTNTLEASLKLPPSLESNLVEWARARDQYKWWIARALQRYLDLFPDKLRPIARPVVIRKCAPLVGVQESTLREMIHTAEVIPRRLETDPDLSDLGFSIWTRLARCDDATIKQIVAQLKKEINEDHALITCAQIDRLKVEHQLRSEGRSAAEIKALYPDHNRLPRLQAQIDLMTFGDHQRKIILLPEDDLDFEQGDTVIIIRRAVSEE